MNFLEIVWQNWTKDIQNSNSRKNMFNLKKFFDKKWKFNLYICDIFLPKISNLSFSECKTKIISTLFIKEMKNLTIQKIFWLWIFVKFVLNYGSGKFSILATSLFFFVQNLDFVQRNFFPSIVVQCSEL